MANNVEHSVEFLYQKIPLKKGSCKNFWPYIEVGRVEIFHPLEVTTDSTNLKSRHLLNRGANMAVKTDQNWCLI